jgi:hypothetical protein
MQITLSNIIKLAAFGLALAILTPPPPSWAKGARQSQQQARQTRASNSNAFFRPANTHRPVRSGPGARSGISSPDWTAIHGAQP